MKLTLLLALALFDANEALVAHAPRFELAGVLSSRSVGRTRLYTWSRGRLVQPLRALVRAALNALPEQELERHYTKRRHPRRAGKPL